MDFDRSLADQPTMAELVACFILTTWLLDAFNVVGYLWPSGERGSGKTVLLRTDADPLDYQAWPHDYRQLLDDLWALALAHLPTLHEYERAVNDKARLARRTLEPWRATLAVALWLEHHDPQNLLRRITRRPREDKYFADVTEDGLWERPQRLSVRYQTERSDLETDAWRPGALDHYLREVERYVRPENPAEAGRPPQEQIAIRYISSRNCSSPQIAATGQAQAQAQGNGTRTCVGKDRCCESVADIRSQITTKTLKVFRNL